VNRSYGNYQLLLEDPEIDAVYIALPPSMHAEWSIQAAQCGKHVLCEKPLAANTSEAIAMADACRQHGVQLMDGVMWVHHDRTRAMRQKLDEGLLGKLRRVTAAFSFHWDEVPEDNIRLKSELAGGALGDLGYYCVRAIWWAFRELPHQVFATSRYYRDVDMNLSGTLWFSHDRMASFDCGFDTVYRKWFEIAGTQGSLVCDDFVLPRQEASARFWLHNSQGSSQQFVTEGCIQEVRMIEQFSSLVRTGKREDRWAEDAIATMRICDCLSRSARQGTPVPVP
jgi:predicted dehydrogenase